MIGRLWSGRTRSGDADASLFDSMAAIRGFAGEEEDVPVIEPRAAELLAEYDDRVRHFDVVVAAP